MSNVSGAGDRSLDMGLSVGSDEAVDVLDHGPGTGRGRRRRPWTWRQRLVAAGAGVLLLLGLAAVAGVSYYNSVPVPALAALPQQTTLYYADATTVLARVGPVDRHALPGDRLNDAVTRAAVAAADPDYWSDSGSKIARQVVRALTPAGSGPVAQVKLLVASRKLEAVHSKQEILTYYLNLVAFGRGTFGIDAAAREYFGKTADRTAPADRQLGTAEAMVLVAMIDQPEADPADPVGSPGFDPTVSASAHTHAVDRWNEIRSAMVDLGYLAGPDSVQYPVTVRPPTVSVTRSLELPVGLAARHALAEARSLPATLAMSADQFDKAGFDIVTTIDQRAQQAVEYAADSSVAGSVMQKQPASLQAAAVIVEPGTGRVLGYFGNHLGSGADYAGWYYNENRDAVGYGEHPGGQTFEVYDLAAALTKGISMSSRWDSPRGAKEFPEADRVAAKLGPIRETGTATCQPTCTLAEASKASLVIPFFDLTMNVGPSDVLATARDAGISSMWDKQLRVDLVGQNIAATAVPMHFGTELGIGQYPITVLDQANAMATFAAGGISARVHFVRQLSLAGKVRYAEPLTNGSLGLSAGQLSDLNWVLSGDPLGRLPGMDSATKSGTWGTPEIPELAAHAWLIGYTRSLAMAVWVGTRNEGPIRPNGTTPVALPAAIYRAAMTQAHASMGLKPAPFPKPAHTGATHPPGSI